MSTDYTPELRALKKFVKVAARLDRKEIRAFVQYRVENGRQAEKFDLSVTVGTIEALFDALDDARKALTK